MTTNEAAGTVNANSEGDLTVKKKNLPRTTILFLPDQEVHYEPNECVTGKCPIVMRHYSHLPPEV